MNTLYSDNVQRLIRSMKEESPEQKETENKNQKDTVTPLSQNIVAW